MRKEIKYTVKENDCWNCISHGVDSNGYPVSFINKKRQRLYRYMFIKNALADGVDLPDEFVVRHTCDNRLCINPKHLIIGTHQQNVQDRVSRNRSAKGEKNGRAKLSSEQVKEIRQDNTTPKMVLAKHYGVDPKLIRDIQNNRTWKHI
jgi:hypothetical protein